MKLLEGKWALVTGSSRGIGLQVARGLAERKCNLVVHGRKPGGTSPGQACPLAPHDLV